MVHAMCPSCGNPNLSEQALYKEGEWFKCECGMELFVEEYDTKWDYCVVSIRYRWPKESVEDETDEVDHNNN